MFQFIKWSIFSWNFYLLGAVFAVLLNNEIFTHLFLSFPFYPGCLTDFVSNFFHKIIVMIPIIIANLLLVFVKQYTNFVFFLNFFSNYLKIILQQIYFLISLDEPIKKTTLLSICGCQFINYLNGKKMISLGLG